MATRIALDNYIYEDVYPAFKEATDEKEITARLVRGFLNHKGMQSLILDSRTPIIVGDIGSGPADTIVKYLTGVKCLSGFTIRATDYLPRYADFKTGEALGNLAEAQSSRTINIIDYSARAGDAFAGNLGDLLSAADGIRASSDFRLVFASHVMYHADSANSLRRLLADIAGNILSPSGVCILFHIANVPGTFQEYRARFGSESAAAASDTGTVAIDDPPIQIDRVCQELGLPVHTLEFLSWLRFGKISSDEWGAFKDPAQYDRIASTNPTAYENLKRLYFIVQRAPNEFASDRSPNGLSTFMDQIAETLERNGFALPLGERMQVFTRSDTPANLRAIIPDALEAAKTSLRRQ
jgi:hypothetical protein